MIFDEYEVNDLYLRIPLQFFADSDEKTEEPTAKRKREARQKGQVLRVLSLILLLVCYLHLYV